MTDEFQDQIAALRRITESQDRTIDELRAEVAKLRDAIRRAGFQVCQTSGDWTIHDVSEYGKAEEARSLEVATRNVELELENSRLRREIMILKTWVPHPSTMSGWDDPDCPDEAAALIREACEIYGIPVPEHLIETR